MKVRKEREVLGLGARIREARETYQEKTEPRPSVNAIAAQAGMSHTNWYKIEKELTVVLPLETLLQIEAVLGVEFGVEL